MEDWKRKGIRVVKELAADTLKWDKNDELEASLVTGGITNILVCVCRRSTDEKVIVRFFGNGSDKVINRNRERLINDWLARYGLCKRTFAEFSEGRVEEWLEGASLTLSQMNHSSYRTRIAHALACLHHTPIPTELQQCIASDHAASGARFAHLIPKELREFSIYFRRSSIWPTAWKWLQLCRSSIEDGSNNFEDVAIPSIERILIRCYSECLRHQKTQKENSSAECIEYSAFDIVLGHQDLLRGNILESDKGEIIFMDFEYAGPCERGFDIANHLCECCGVDCDWKNFPDTNERKCFLRSYFANFPRSPDDMDHVVDSVNKFLELFIRVSHLYWGLWSLVQSMTSKIDFDYGLYARKRISAALDNSNQYP